MKDFIILCIAVLISVALLVKFGWLIPAAITLCYAFLTIRKDELTILDFIKYKNANYTRQKVWVGAWVTTKTEGVMQLWQKKKNQKKVSVNLRCG